MKNVLWTLFFVSHNCLAVTIAYPLKKPTQTVYYLGSAMAIQECLEKSLHDTSYSFNEVPLYQECHNSCYQKMGLVRDYLHENEPKKNGFLNKNRSKKNDNSLDSFCKPFQENSWFFVAVNIHTSSLKYAFFSCVKDSKLNEEDVISVCEKIFSDSVR